MRPELAANPNGCLKGNMIYSDEKGEQLPAKVECQMGSAVLKREVHSRCWRGVEWKRRVPNLGCGVLMGFEEHPYWRRRAETWAGQECGMLYRSTKPARGAPMGIEDHRSGGAPQACGKGWNSKNPHRAVLLGFEELPSQVEDSVSNSSGPSLRVRVLVRVQVQTELSPH